MVNVWFDMTLASLAKMGNPAGQGLPLCHSFLSQSGARTRLCGARLSAQLWTLPHLKMNGFAPTCGILGRAWDGYDLC